MTRRGKRDLAFRELRYCRNSYCSRHKNSSTDGCQRPVTAAASAAAAGAGRSHVDQQLDRVAVGADDRGDG